jgi:hypothetical protein
VLGDIHLDPKRQIDGDVVSQVENYESVNAEEKAAEILQEAELSLEEGDPAGLEAEGEAVVSSEDAFVVAASDEEILAEEMKWDAEASSSYEPDPQVDL